MAAGSEVIVNKDLFYEKLDEYFKETDMTKTNPWREDHFNKVLKASRRDGSGVEEGQNKNFDDYYRRKYDILEVGAVINIVFKPSKEGEPAVFVAPYD